MLEVKNLKFRYNGFEVNASLNVNKGEILTLLGPNGCGKTTLLRCIYGILNPKTPCVYLDGKDVHSMDLRERAKKMGYVPQTHHPGFPYTVLEFVVMGRASQISTFESPGSEDYRIALEALKLVGIENLADKPYTQISGGQLQLALIARALVQNPRAILFDEPTAHLDFKNQVKVLEMIRRITAEKKVATILTLHDPNLAGMYSDKIALIKGGKIHAVGEPEEVLTENELSQVYEISIKVINADSFRFVIPVLNELKNH
ncbi:ABC transporter ATP-binding protein [Archaeoglobus veneficus]|uniref:Phosphonate-transporting ATPase n=1 Tax=Archaeoglobus veneficus (strain DSM 11195 / SNP6) TaxID=693661 RepID=F2KPN3_ARCVS|nr:ABC transporter ATP-binding protein [Archaeoglobus veneficus]AEA47561.1 Phosphonate-transporting ATPase [Archaeoglobus veneficus SNP6]